MIGDSAWIDLRYNEKDAGRVLVKVELAEFIGSGTSGSKGYGMEQQTGLSGQQTGFSGQQTGLSGQQTFEGQQIGGQYQPPKEGHVQ